MRTSSALRALAAAAPVLSAAAVSPALAQDDQIRPDATMLQFPDVSATTIVFVYANDLWQVDREGGTAVRLASPPGGEIFPRYSPDGSTIAFVGNYEGDRDLYSIPASGGGIARRATHHPTDEVLCDWTPDGHLLFFANAMMDLARQTQLFTVAPTGGLPEKLPVPYGANGSISDDGRWLAYTPHTRDHRTWKRYRGGMATDIWLFDLDEHTSRRITDWEGTDSQPMWHDGLVYYLSDAGPTHRLNIWVYDPDTDEHREITSFDRHDVRWPSMGPGPDGGGEIVFQNGPRIHLLDLGTERSRPVEIVIAGDRPTLRPQRVQYKDFVGGGDISSTGKRAVVETRGELWSLPAEKGVVRNLTRTSGVAERNPAWSPDGRWIAYLSDETGEYEVYITQSDGRGETRQLTDDGTCFRSIQGWSPDSKKIAYTEKTGALFLLDVESGESTHVATDAWAEEPEVSFSHDSRWLATSLTDPDNRNGVVHLYDIETGELHAVTSPMFSSASPAFDRKGEWLYFTSGRAFAPTYSDIDTSFIYRDSGVLLAVPLNEEVEYPWTPENEEEEWEEDDEEDGDDEEDEEDEDGDEEDEGEEDEENGDDGDDGNGEDEGDDENGDDDANGDDEGDDADDDDDDEDDGPSSPIEGVWEGVVRGLDAMGMPELAFTMTIVAREDGTFFGTSEAMGESSDFDEVTFDEATGEFTTKSTDKGITTTMRGTLEGETLTGTWQIVEMGLSGEWEATRTSTDVGDAEDEAEEAKPLRVDLEGFERRALLLPVEPGRFSQLAVNDKGHLLYLRGAEEMPAIKLFDITEKDEGERNVVAGAMGFTLSGDGKKMAVMGPGGLAIVSTAPGQSLAKTIPTDRMRGFIDPRAEWRQIFVEAWRLFRDYFYDEQMHGVDWQAVRERYEPMVDDCVTREDLSMVIREMIAELNVGHAYYFGGDVEDEPSDTVGMLGCDFELVETEEGTAYRIARIYEGGIWDADARGPLSRPGVDVKEGDYLLAVNGVALNTDVDPWAAFLGRAGQVTEITVSEKPVLDDESARHVLIEPLNDETDLRYRAWVEQKRAYVDEQTDGRIGYIYVPNTGRQGQNELFRQFYGQIDKAGLIIDERWNGGGQIPTRFIELLNRPRTNYWARRDGKDWPWPPDSHQGPKTMLINGLAGSGGDMFPALFRQAGLGKLIGTRTWGGLVGLSGNPRLIDGGYVAVPTFGFYEVDGTWGIEGHGVDPDIEVIDDPALMVDGGDPQLDAAIEHILAEAERTPYSPPKRPASPDRSGMGISEEDR